jgi:acetyl esterase/lipase
LKHPLVSPALSYLGGLPPLLFIAGDREVLRDEIIYACVLFPLTPWFVVTHHRRLRRAHRAAHPERFPLSDEIKKLYPAFKLVETSMPPTPVHLQVYDGILYSLRHAFV